MSIRASPILAHLHAVQAIRDAARSDSSLSARVHALKVYQGRRFERTYADWIAQATAQRACRFFLDELYGAKDFTARDAQFARIVPTMTRMFPDELSLTILSLAALHELSEALDLAMARNLPQQTVDAGAYVVAWQATGRRTDRTRQIALMREVGNALSIYTRRPLLRRALKMMRAPAAAAGLGSLQAFLEEGFDAFASLPDASRFLDTVSSRETALADRLFDVTGDAFASGGLPGDPAHGGPGDDPLGQLP